MKLNQYELSLIQRIVQYGEVYFRPTKFMRRLVKRLKKKGLIRVQRSKLILAE